MYTGVQKGYRYTRVFLLGRVGLIEDEVVVPHTVMKKQTNRKLGVYRGAERVQIHQGISVRKSGAHRRRDGSSAHSNEKAN